jgi:hypothetical protein
MDASQRSGATSTPPLMMLGAYLPALVCIFERPNDASADET